MSEDVLMMLAPCIRCQRPFYSDPDTVPSVWVHEVTRCPVRPDLSPIVPGEPCTSREPVCDSCLPVLKAGPGSVLVLFPHARLDPPPAPDLALLSKT